MVSHFKASKKWIKSKRTEPGICRFSQTLPSEVTLGSSNHAQLRQSPFPFQSPPNLTYSLTLASPASEAISFKIMPLSCFNPERPTFQCIQSRPAVERESSGFSVHKDLQLNFGNQLNLTLCPINRLSAPIECSSFIRARTGEISCLQILYTCELSIE